MSHPSTTKDKKTGAETVRWSLTDLYTGINDPAIAADIENVAKAAKSFVAQYKSKLHTLTAQQLADAYAQIERILTPLYKASQFSSLVYATDTANEEAKKLVAKIDEAESDIGNLIVFFDLELGAMKEEDFQKFENAPELNNYAYDLKRTRETAHYNLSEKEEQVINLKNLVGVSGFRKLYEELTSSFEFEFEVDGELKKMNGSELRALRQHKDASVRRAAMKLFLNRYSDNKLVLTNIFNNVIKNHGIERKMRGYKSPISIRNVGNDLDDDAIAALHEVTTESYSLVQDYYRLKAQILKMPDMTLADIYAPMPQADRTYTYDEAKSLVLEGFKAFDEDFYLKAKLMFDENRIDAPVTPKKRGGAFCSASTPDVNPYVLLNFLGRPRDVATMAHELGHALHDLYCSKQTLINFHPILPLAETASVFAEMLVTDLLRKKETDPLARQALLTDKLEDIFATSHRQNMFSKFELATHETISERIMSSDELCAAYKGELTTMFGDSVKITEEFHWEWAAIPHIYEWPFYVYAYNFGNLLVMALYQQYLEEGADFIPKFKDFLSQGSAASPVDICQIVGADIKNPQFWRKSLAYIEGLISELKELLAAN